MSKMRFFALQELANRQPLEVTTPSNHNKQAFSGGLFSKNTNIFENTP